MKRLGAFVGLLLAACLSCHLFAADPKPQIDGPVTAVAGDMITLDATKSVGVKHFRWRLLAPQIPGRKLLEAAPDNKTCRIASYPATYVVQLLVGNEEGVDAVTHQIIVSGECVTPLPNPPAPTPTPVPPGPGPGPGPTPDPGPTPPPVPPPNPDPVFPPGQFSISLDVYKWASAVESPKRAQECLALAQAGEALAAQIAAGTVKGDQAILNAIGAALELSTNGDVAAWKPFRQQLANRVKTIYFAGKLKSAADWSALIREVSLGLKAVK